MITKLEQKQLKNLFQGHYAEDVLKILSVKRVFNRNGKPYSAKYVRTIFQGVRQNTAIESAIWHVAALRKKERELFELEKSKILE